MSTPAKIPLGALVRDTVSGFEGICCSRTDYLSGCTRIALQPLVREDGKMPEMAHFDEPLCIVVAVGIAAQPSDNGGPRPAPSQHAAPVR